MMLAGCLLIYLAISKDYEPLLLLPIGFGAILTNLPLTGMTTEEGFLGILYNFGIATELFPLFVFIGVGAMTDFGPLLENPKMALLGAAGQFGIFGTLMIALLLGFPHEPGRFHRDHWRDRRTYRHLRILKTGARTPWAHSGLCVQLYVTRSDHPATGHAPDDHRCRATCTHALHTEGRIPRCPNTIPDHRYHRCIPDRPQSITPHRRIDVREPDPRSSVSWSD